jgi:hypothetical protein
VIAFEIPGTRRYCQGYGKPDLHLDSHVPNSNVQIVRAAIRFIATQFHYGMDLCWTLMASSVMNLPITHVHPEAGSWISHMRVAHAGRAE